MDVAWLKQRASDVGFVQQLVVIYPSHIYASYNRFRHPDLAILHPSSGWRPKVLIEVTDIIHLSAEACQPTA